MSTRLYVRFTRDANVPGARSAWVLRDSRGTLLRRGEDTFAALPSADQIIGVLAQDLVLIRAVPLPPGRRARTPAALANAMEPYLLTDPAANYVLLLEERAAGSALIAAIARKWLDAVLGECARARRSPARLIVESSLLERSRDRWIAVCRPDGGFLATPDGLAVALDRAPDDGIPEGLVWQARAATAGAAQSQALRVHADPSLRVDTDRWQAALGMTVERAGPWDWTQAVGPETGFRLEAVPDFLSALGSNRSTTEARMRHWRLPLALAALALILHIGASAIHWGMRAAERAALRAEIDAVFRKSVSASEPLVDAVLQTRRALAAAQRASGQYAPDDFVPLLGRLAAESANIAPHAMVTLQYGAGALTAEWRGVPAANVERMAEQLRARGMRVEITTAAPLTRVTLRASP